MSNRKYFVYALTCGGEIRYIGITSQTLSRRLCQHLSDAKRASRKEHKTNWIRKCLADGAKVEIKLLRKWMDENDAFRIERQIIAKLRPQLVNIHEGGTSGYNGLSEDAKERHRANSRKGIEATEHCKRMLEIRWKNERERRDAYALKNPAQKPRIVARYHVIRDEVRERVALIFNTDRPCDIRRKLRTLKGVW